MANSVRTMTHLADELRRQVIAEAAYFRAEHTGFGSDSLKNWFEAEAEIDRMLQQEVGAQSESESKESEKRLSEGRPRQSDKAAQVGTKT